MSAPTVRPARERGQIIVLFALALVAIVAGVGLVLDGGSAYAQRRTEQSAADLAALAAANDFWLNGSLTGATATARTVAKANGFDHGTNNVSVNLSITTTNGAQVKVDISAPHANNFASIVGMSNWTVSTTATALAGFPDSAHHAGPVIFSIDAFGTDGEPLSQYGDPNNPYDFGEGNGDIPNGPGDLAWTNYATGNVDTNQVDDIILGTLVIDKTITSGVYIGQHNDGNHTALYDDVNTYLSGTDITVPVVDNGGNFMGWATFHIVSSDGSGKHIKGYFRSHWNNEDLYVGSCSLGTCPRYLGDQNIYLVN
jgi:hypothetical protein